VAYPFLPIATYLSVAGIPGEWSGRTDQPQNLRPNLKALPGRERAGRYGVTTPTAARAIRIYHMFPSWGHLPEGSMDTVVRGMKGMKESAMGGISKVAGSLQELDPRIIEQITSRINFPASKDNLISQAKENQAPQGLLDVLNQFQDKQYNNSEDIKSEFQRIQQK
jgi:hypothetical protein